MEVWVWSLAIPCGSFDGQSDIRTGFHLEYLNHYHSTSAPTPYFIPLPLTLYSLGNLPALLNTTFLCRVPCLTNLCLGKGKGHSITCHSRHRWEVPERVGDNTTPRSLYPHDRATVPIVEETEWARGQSGQVWRRANPLPALGIEPCTIQPVMSFCTNYTILAPPSPGSERQTSPANQSYVEHIITFSLGNDCNHWIQNILSYCVLSKNVKIVIHETIILPVLCGFETRPCTCKSWVWCEGIEDNVLRKTLRTCEKWNSGLLEKTCLWSFIILPVYNVPANKMKEDEVIVTGAKW